MKNPVLASIRLYTLSFLVLIGGHGIGQTVENYQIEPTGELGPLGIYGSIDLGHSSAIDGEWAVLGDPKGSPRKAGIATGTCLVYRRTEQGWILWQTLAPTSNQILQRFGIFVALHGEEMAVGASVGGLDQAGRVHIFRLVGDEWVETQQLGAFVGGAHGYSFGANVEFDEETLVVGSQGYPASVFGEPYGAAYVFERVTGRWVFTQRLFPPLHAETPHEYWGVFGRACSVDGDILAIGAGGGWQGMAFVYRRGPSGWTREADLYLPQFDPQFTFTLGYSVQVSGTTIAVGAPGSLGALYPGYTSVWIYDYDEQLGEWSQTQGFRASDWNLPPSGTDQFGESLSLRGDRLLVGAKRGDLNGPLSGTAYLFERSNGVWEETERFIASDPNDYPGGVGSSGIFGASVALDGNSNRMIIGAPNAYLPDYATPFPGKAYFFDLNQGQVVCEGSPNQTGAGARFTVTGNRQVGDANLSLSVYDAPPGFAGIFLVGPGGTPMPFGATGSLCVGQPFARLTGIRTIGPGGSAMHEVDFTVPPASGLLFPGATLTFQFAHRDIDSASGQATLNASDAVQVVFE